MASTRFYLDLRGKAGDGKGSVLIVLYHNSSTTSFATGVRLAPSEWNKKSQTAMKVPGVEAINTTLQTRKAEIDKAIAILSMSEDFESMTAPELKEEVMKGRHRKNGKLYISEVFQDYLEKNALKENTRDIYEITLRKILSFSGERTRLDDITFAWLKTFEQELSKTQGINGRSIYLRALRAVCNHAKNSNLTTKYPFENFHIKAEVTQKRSVSVESLREFMMFETTERKSMYRDYFFLMFFLIGINSKDLLLAKKNQVIDGRLDYVREKTMKKYSVKIEPEAQILIERYAGSGDYLLEAMDHCMHYKNFTREINDALKTIGPEIEEEIPTDTLFCNTRKRIEPLLPDITTYYSRHCWATFAYEIGIPMDIISQALGHSFGNRTTLIYIKPDQSKVDEANRLVIDYLLNYS